MVESDASENYRRDPFAVLLPRPMEAYGFENCVEQSQPIEAIGVEFEDEEVVYGHSGFHFHTPATGDLFVETDPALKYKVLHTEETFEFLEDLNTAHQQQYAVNFNYQKVKGARILRTLCHLERLLALGAAQRAVI